jgi:hypothetical protein
MMDCMMDEIGLYEHDTRGSHFTWSNRQTNGVIYSRIDRAICNREWFINYPNCEVEVLNPHISDHSPLRVRLLDTNTGMNRYQTRFKFLNCVMERPEFLDMVTNSWNKEEIGRPMYVLWRKLKRLQPILRGLTRKVTTGAQKIQDSRIQLEQAQHLLAGDIFNQEYITAVKYWSDEIIQTTELEEKILMQKSKITWLKLGDGNNAYFHATIRGKNKQAGIYKLEDHNGRVLTEFKDIEKEVLRFYVDLVGTSSQRLLHVDIAAIRNGTQLQEIHQNSLTQPITDQEIWNALKNIEDTKAPGIDGFNSKFFKASWNVIKSDVIAAVHEFFDYDRLYAPINCALVTLIPKSSDAKTMKDMRPIACCTTMYKIISKILTTRLSKVITVVVDESQSAFVPGKIIHDNIIIAHELLRGYNRKHISPRCAIQMDLQKAYDTVEWTALEMIMREMNFPKKFINWIMICVSTVSYKYAINGQQSELLKAKRGLRQGDPISPLLFVLIMEYLHRCLKNLHKKPDFNFHPKCEKLQITNICFADDLIMFTRGDETSVKLMMGEFKKFSDSTGLKANPAKCKVYFGGVPTLEQ